RRTDLSAHAENDDVAGKRLQRGDQRRRRRGHHLLEVLHVAQAIGQRFRGLDHPGVLSLNRGGCERACHNPSDANGSAVGAARYHAQMALAAKPAREPVRFGYEFTLSRAPIRGKRTRTQPATLVKHPEPRTIVHGEAHVREPAMKVFMFHLMPYAYLDMNFSDKYRAAWVVLPNSYFDPKKGHELYNRYLDELELAAELGF